MCVFSCLFSNKQTHTQTHKQNKLSAATDEVIRFVGSPTDRPGLRLPRWDYECHGSDLIKLKEAAMFLRKVLVSHVAVPSLSSHIVVQQRSHNEKLGAFYKTYFCDLIAKGELPYLSKESCGVYGSHRRKGCCCFVFFFENA
jgi:hypothetical protein